MPQQNRSQARIIADILTVARDENTSGAGVGVTILLRRGNLSYSRFMRLATDLISAGLLIQMGEGSDVSRYRISNKGMDFLHAYGQFEDFAESFGLRL